ncbi:MAG: hypothetical protein JWQ19_2252 [Subtercola sp.]|nr:hypothetical protein [Subtercola sp.]
MSTRRLVPPSERTAQGDGRRASGWLHALIVGVATAAAALVIGGLTSWGQYLLPEALRSFSNSAGAWTMFAFLLVWLGRSRPLYAAVLGIVVFEGLNEGYGIVSGWRGAFYSDPFANIWTILALLVGPVIGICASLTRHDLPARRVIWVTPLCVVLLGEGIYGLIALHTETSPVYWSLQIALSIGFFAAAAWRGKSLRMNALAAAVSLIGAAAFFFIYQLG